MAFSTPRILIVTALFSPTRMIGGRRPERIALHLNRLGWRVTVLTLRPRYIRPVDRQADPFPDIEVIRTHALMPGDMLRSASRVLRNATASSGVGGRRRHAPEPGAPEPPGPSGEVGGEGSSTPKRLFWRWVSSWEFPDPWFAWVPFALRAVRGRRFDVILATLPPFTPALIARTLADRTGARLILDYRDPWAEVPRIDWGEGWHEGLRIRHQKTEDSCLRRADIILGVTPTICSWLRRRTEKQVLLVPNFYEAAQPNVAGTTVDTHVQIVYAGSLAYGRSLEPIIAAIARLSEEVGPDRLQLVYIGKKGFKVRAQAEALGVGAYIDQRGEVEAAEARSRIADSSASIVIVSKDYDYAIPGKVFEVLAAGRPMIVLAPAACDMADLVSRHQLGWCHEPKDVDGLVRTLKDLLEGRIPLPRNLHQLQGEYVMASLDRTLREVSGGRDQIGSPASAPLGRGTSSSGQVLREAEEKARSVAHVNREGNDGKHSQMIGSPRDPHSEENGPGHIEGHNRDEKRRMGPAENSQSEAKHESDHE